MADSTVAAERNRFLALHAVDRPGACELFALTPSSLAITVYRQQIRALNLAYAIYARDPSVAPQKQVAIIGGGFAGVTVAAGLLTKGFEVHLFEQRPELCHLQSGCETRSLHPTIYEWPSPNSDLADARLPLLNWSAGTAGEVARVVERQFRHITRRDGVRYHEYLRANARILDDRVEWDNADVENKKEGHLGRGGRARFDVVVVAVGFGVEKGVADTGAVSYWRNDRFGQPQPGVRSERRELVYVSGVGDGAMIDLVRVCLRGFKHDRLIDDLFADLPLLVDKLREIRDAHLEDLSVNRSATLGGRLNALRDEPDESDLGTQVLRFRGRIKDRLRSDTRAIFNGRAASFSRILNANGRSFLNVILAYCLYEAKAFSYIGGECSYMGDTDAAQISGYGQLRFDEAIIRHGTKRKRVLRATGLTKKEVRKLFKKQKALDPRQAAARLWDPGWWSLPPEPDLGDVWWLERVPR